MLYGVTIETHFFNNMNKYLKNKSHYIKQPSNFELEDYVEESLSTTLLNHPRLTNYTLIQNKMLT